MRCAVIGCGYVADFYMQTRVSHPELEWLGLWDRDPDRLRTCSQQWNIPAYASEDALLKDALLDTVLNLTNPRSHYDVTARCLDHGKHVYSEKPLGMTLSEAEDLLTRASERHRHLSSAPCSLLSPPAQNLWRALRASAIGRVRLVYASFDDGMIAPAQQPWTWRNGTGMPWPAQDEFETGCTYQHAGYLLTWLTAFFGPARRVTAFASVQLADKGIPVAEMAPDFTVGCIEYDAGIVARVTCGLVAPRDKSLTIIGDDGVLMVRNVRDETCPVLIQRRGQRRSSAASFATAVASRLGGQAGTAVVEALSWDQYAAGTSMEGLVASAKPVDFLRGPGELAAAVKEGRPSRLSAELGVHTVELIERLQYPERFAGRPDMRTSCPPIAPL